MGLSIRFRPAITAVCLCVSACALQTAGTSARRSGSDDRDPETRSGGGPFAPGSSEDGPFTPYDSQDAGVGEEIECVPNSRFCVNGLVRTCNGDGDGLVAAGDGSYEACRRASRAMDDALQSCIDSAPHALAPEDHAQVVVTPEGVVCSPACNEYGDTVLAPVDRDGVTTFCFDHVHIPKEVTVTHAAGLDSPQVWLVRTTVEIEGEVLVGGSDATEAEAGVGGPGGGAGGGPSGVEGKAGAGVCGGQGGARQGTTSDRAAGGGGGGGHLGLGGRGGDGLNPSASQTGEGGDGGGVCVDDRALTAGGGGGGGGDGTCGAECGFPGGGGGGALQIAAATGIRVRGTVDASGGDGYGDRDGAYGGGGGGGGGAGGMVVLSAETVELEGHVRVEGGKGGEAGAGSGGHGAERDRLHGEPGATFKEAGEGGAGGGGGAGRVIVEAATVKDDACNRASPKTACELLVHP